MTRFAAISFAVACAVWLASTAAHATPDPRPAAVALRRPLPGARVSTRNAQWQIRRPGVLTRVPGARPRVVGTAATLATTRVASAAIATARPAPPLDTVATAGVDRPAAAAVGASSGRAPGRFFPRPYRGAVATVKRLASEGTRVGIVTNNSFGNVAAIAERYGFDDALSFIAGARGLDGNLIDGLPAKPDPAMFREMTNSLGIDPSELMFVGDTAKSDVRGPVDFGGIGVGVLNRHGSSTERELLAEGPHAVLGGIDKVPALLGVLRGQTPLARDADRRALQLARMGIVRLRRDVVARLLAKQPYTIRAVGMDLDGTLTDPYPEFLEAVYQSMREIGRPMDRAQVAAAIAHRQFGSAFHELSDRYPGFSEAFARRFADVGQHPPSFAAGAAAQGAAPASWRN